MLHSPLIKAIVLDVFWWLFLHKYQPDSVAQDGFFNRISLNYVSLLIKCQSWSYGDVFLQEFVGVLSQATYSCFCCSFPQSWLQFGQNYFKTELCDLVYQWVGGIPPIAGIFQTWNCDILEPVELKETKSVTKESRRSRKGFSVSLFGPVSDNNLRSGSASFINSASSSRRRKRILPGSRVQTPRGTKIPSNDLFGKMIDNDLCPVYNNSSFIITSGSIQENEKISIGRAATNVSKWRDEDNAIPYSQSYPIEYGPEFMKDKFNLFGLSPLVQNFLQKYHLEPLSGMNIYVTRTAIKGLPKSELLTYHDVIEEGFRKLFTLKLVKNNLYQQQIKGLAMFNRKLIEEHEAFKRREADLQAKKKEVKTTCPFHPKVGNIWGCLW
uniref:Uncharacterized protein n=1 Tax=Callorhinchus milii TaxID=7868 RepID=A0A4W3HBY4_CALMI